MSHVNRKSIVQTRTSNGNTSNSNSKSNSNTITITSINQRGCNPTVIAIYYARKQQPSACVCVLCPSRSSLEHEPFTHPTANKVLAWILSRETQPFLSLAPLHNCTREWLPLPGMLPSPSQANRNATLGALFHHALLTFSRVPNPVVTWEETIGGCNHLRGACCTLPRQSKLGRMHIV